MRKDKAALGQLWLQQDDKFLGVSAAYKQKQFIVDIKNSWEGKTHCCPSIFVQFGLNKIAHQNQSSRLPYS